MTTPSRPKIDLSKCVDSHGDILFRYAIVRVGYKEMAEDLVQDTFLATHKAQIVLRGTHQSAPGWYIAS
jgi:DNA-directed RNA polymerase specialized sigma24 family protein